jgi:uncharacterized membrane protein (DUF106 family)
MTIDITIITAAIVGIVSYIYNKGLEEMINNTKQWQREVDAFNQREQRKEDEEDRKHKDKDNEH